MVAENKSDLVEQEVVDEEVARKEGKELGVIFAVTSQKNIRRINSLFVYSNY